MEPKSRWGEAKVSRGVAHRLLLSDLSSPGSCGAVGLCAFIGPLERAPRVVLRRRSH